MAISLNGASGINPSDYPSIYIKDSEKDKTISEIGSGSSDAEIMAAAKEFEAYMIEQIYKGMEKTVMRAEEKSQYEEYFGDMLVQEYAKNASAQGTFGLAERLYESMKNQYSNGISND